MEAVVEAVSEVIGQAAGLDPIQKLFLNAIRDYSLKS
ncbi:hypothetical protein P4O66_015018, partial [Electrophorus voltai]